MAPRWHGEWRPAVLAWVTARVVLAAGYVVALVAAEEVGAARRDEIADRPLAIWDGAFYRDIVSVGYDDLPTEAIRFFVGFPAAGWLLDRLLPIGATAALTLVANAAALVAGALMARFARSEGLDAAVGERSTWLLALFPSAFVLALPYSEALYLVAALGAFLAMAGRRWGWLAVAGFGAGVTRPIGVFVAPAAALTVWRSADRRDPRAWASTLAPVAGLATHLVVARSVTGDWLAPLDEQRPHRGDFVDPVSRLLRGAGDLLGDERLGDGLHLPFAVLFVVLAALGVRRLSPPVALYTVALVVVALSADNLNSVERYAVNAFPLLVVLASLATRPAVERVVWSLCAGGLVGLSALAWLGSYVP